MTNIYPLLNRSKKIDLNEIDIKKDVSPVYQPLECVQRQGDLLYLPAGWSHMTENIENKFNGGNSGAQARSSFTVGIGGQAVWLADDRIKHCEKILKSNPSNSYDCLKGMAMSLLSRSTNTHHRDSQDNSLIQAAEYAR